MRTTKILIVSCVCCFTSTGYAQFWKKLGKKVEKAAERTIERKVEKKTEKEVSKAFDSVFENNEKEKAKKEQRKEKKEKVPNVESVKTTKENYSSDFEPGKTIVFEEHFANDALNDFPVTWNTNSGGAIVTFSEAPEKWLRLDNGGIFLPEKVNRIPENATLEFDIYFDQRNHINNGIYIDLVQLNRNKVFAQYRYFNIAESLKYAKIKIKEGVSLWLEPSSVYKNQGNLSVEAYADGEIFLENNKGFKGFSLESRTAHIAIWRQKSRLRLYVNQVKVLDVPRAFSVGKIYNSLVFRTHKGNKETFYISNIRLAEAGEDLRHALLEKGSFTTNAIRFESGKSILKKESIAMIQELVEVLNERPEVPVQIIGHTDSDGSASFNLNLSKERAYAVKEKMIKLGLQNYQRVSAEGKGENEPVADNATNDGKAKNRRVEFKIIK